MTARRLPYMNRIVRHISVDLDTNCWNFTGSKKASGHGILRRHHEHHSPSVLAHRVVYETIRGPVPGLVLHHECLNPSCVNPWHLTAMTVSEHMSLHNAGRTHCKHGHEFNEANTIIRVSSSGRPYKVCRECKRLISERRYDKKRKRPKKQAA